MGQSGGRVLQRHRPGTPESLGGAKVGRHPHLADRRAAGDVVDDHDRPEAKIRFVVVDDLGRIQFVREAKQILHCSAPRRAPPPKSIVVRRIGTSRWKPSVLASPLPIAPDRRGAGAGTDDSPRTVATRCIRRLRGALDLDLLDLLNGLRRLGKGDRENALDEAGFDLVGVDVVAHWDHPLEAAIGPLDHVVVLLLVF